MKTMLFLIFTFYYLLFTSYSCAQDFTDEKTPGYQKLSFTASGTESCSPESGIFVIDAETGDLSEWSGIEQSGSCTFTNESVAAAHCNYGFKVTFDGTNKNCNAEYNLSSPQSEIYIRFYIYLDPSLSINGTAWQTNEWLNLIDLSGTRVLFSLRWQNNGSGVPTMWIGYPLASGSTLYDENADIRTGWRIVEIYCKFDNAAGSDIIRLYLDGDPSPVITWSALNIAYDVATIELGPIWMNATPENGDYIYFDDIVGSSSYIGTY